MLYIHGTNAWRVIEEHRRKRSTMPSEVQNKQAEADEGHSTEDSGLGIPLRAAHAM